MRGDRGQAYTLEGVLAATLIVLATLYGIQSIDTRSGDDVSQTEIQQLEYRATDLLSVARTTGALQNVTLCYSSRPGPITGERTTQRSQFEAMLDQTFDSQNNQYNLYISYWDPSDDERVTELVSERSDTPSTRPPPGAATATTSVTVADTMAIRFGDCTTRGPQLEQGISTFYLDDIDEQAQLYNVVEVRLVVW